MFKFCYHSPIQGKCFKEATRRPIIITIRWILTVSVYVIVLENYSNGKAEFQRFGKSNPDKALGRQLEKANHGNASQLFPVSGYS